MTPFELSIAPVQFGFIFGSALLSPCAIGNGVRIDIVNNGRPVDEGLLDEEQEHSRVAICRDWESAELWEVDKDQFLTNSKVVCDGHRHRCWKVGLAAV